MANDDRFAQSDQWLDRQGPEQHVVVSSRARYARNLPLIAFPMRASTDELQVVVNQVREAVASVPAFRGGFDFNLTGIRQIERNYLKENHLISTEMERGGEARVIFISSDVKLAIMVNEEDHLRMFALEGGLQSFEALNAVIALEDQLSRALQFAYSPRYGYLTACPTNTGTGLRASVMLHLPALSMLKQLPDLVKRMPQQGLTVRGFYGENSDNMGDFFQVSNEVTLGITEQEIVQRLHMVVEDLVRKEESARRHLFERQHEAVEDEIWRAYGLLTHARIITSQEAVALLSKLRFGIDRSYFRNLSHSALNRLIIDVQPGHLQFSGGAEVTPRNRDLMRAEMLRRRLQNPVDRN